MNRYFIFFFIFCVVNTLLAQELTVFNEEDQSPLAGATITIENSDGSPVYLSTDLNGKAQLKAHHFGSRHYLIVQLTYIGFQSLRDTVFKGIDKHIFLSPTAYEMDDVVITAQYSPTSIENSVHQIKVINREKIENMAAVNLQDVLSNELNVRLSQDNILGAGMSLQGISGQNVKILIDGVPMIGRLDGQIDLNQINLNDVERIEIVQGPLSVNYGSNALAGTINIITKKESKEQLSLRLTSYSENSGQFNQEINIGTRFKKQHSVRLSLGRNFFDGWNKGDDFWPSFKAERADSGRVKQWKPKEQYFGRLQYHFNYKQMLIGYKGELFEEKITNLGYPRRGITTYTAFDDYYHTQRMDNAVLVRGKLNRNWNLNWTAAYNDFERIKEARRTDLVTLESSLIPEVSGNDQQDTSTFNLWMSRGSIARTKDSTWLNYELGYDITIENASGKRIEGGERQIGDYAGFITSELLLTKHLILKPALRYSYNTRYDAPVTPAINLKYAPGKTAIRLSYAKGFRAPTLKELYFNFNDVNHSLFGNPDLKAEQSDNYSASISQKWLLKEQLIKTELSAFYNEIYNQISFAQSGFSGDTLLYFNIGENRTKGLNLNVSALCNNFKLNLGASYIGRYNRLSQENPIETYSYSSEFVANASYQFKRPQLTFALFLKHQGELPGFGYDANGELLKQTIESYQLLDLTLSKHFWNKRLQFTMGLKNALNVQNVQANLSGGAHSGGGGSISVGTGRTALVKLSLHFKKK